MTPPTCDHLAAQQHWVIARRQLLALGWSKEEIRWAVDAKRLWPVHRGVYAVGRRDLTREGRWMAAVLACGEHAVLSHTPAGLLWQLLERGDERPHVTTARHRRGPEGVTTHEALADVDHQRGIPVTTKIQTLVDLTADLDPDPLKAAVRRSLQRGVDLQELRAAVAHPATDWRKARVRAVLQQWIPNIELTQSELEVRFYELVHRAGLPMPELQRPFGPYRSDFLWPAAKLIVETDGREHLTAAARQADAARDRMFAAAGYVVLRFMWADVVNDPAGVAAEVSRWCGRGSARA